MKMLLFERVAKVRACVCVTMCMCVSTFLCFNFQRQRHKAEIGQHKYKPTNQVVISAHKVDNSLSNV